mgnify:FL=1
MELNILIAAPDEQSCKALKKQLAHFAHYTDLDRVSFLLCSDPRAVDAITPSLWAGLHLAFVDLAGPESGAIGQRLYQNNPFCRLIYYGHGRSELAALLPSRPVWYWDVDGPAALSEIFFDQLSALRGDPGFLCYSDRCRSLAVPYSGILCLYSQKRAVYIHTAQGEAGPIPKPLDSVAATLPRALFVRVHQSFLVNRGHLRTLNKSTRILTLDDGYEVPVSRAFYAQTVAAFCQNGTVGGQNYKIPDTSRADGLYSVQEEGTT